MALSAEQIVLIETHLGADTADESAVAALRPLLPGISLTKCDTSDVDAERAFLEFKHFNVYLLDTSDHCVVMTTDPSRATGLVVGKNRVITP